MIIKFIFQDPLNSTNSLNTVKMEPELDEGGCEFQDFEQYLVNLSSSQTPNNELDLNLTAYDLQSRMDLNTNILDFWGVQVTPLATVANVVLSIPIAQGNKKRCSTAVDYISSKQFNESNIDNILLIRLNDDILYDD